MPASAATRTATTRRPPASAARDDRPTDRPTNRWMDVSLMKSFFLALWMHMDPWFLRVRNAEIGRSSRGRPAVDMDCEHVFSFQDFKMTRGPCLRSLLLLKVRWLRKLDCNLCWASNDYLACTTDAKGSDGQELVGTPVSQACCFHLEIMAHLTARPFQPGFTQHFHDIFCPDKDGS